MSIFRDIYNYIRGYHSISNNGIREIPGSIKYFCTNIECPFYLEEVPYGITAVYCDKCGKQASVKCKLCEKKNIFPYVEIPPSHSCAVIYGMYIYEKYGYD